uniref:Uncharacterized protein n=1 Tax=Mimivirus LCMiAC02 TaxID=2506609 RepID=A0A4P6VP96_9VIRU|nr:MAG: hypothetical protein LCMiAC02_04940 [Mimivirus LCMiAC02]
MTQILIVIIIILILILFSVFNKKIEPFWDITPHKYRWNIFKCLTSECVMDKSYECYKWCDNWPEPGGSNKCRRKCFDYADLQSDNLKYNNYFWNRLLPKFSDAYLY